MKSELPIEKSDTLGNIRRTMYLLLESHGLKLTPELSNKIKQLMSNYLHIGTEKIAAKYSKLKNPQFKFDPSTEESRNEKQL